MLHQGGERLLKRLFLFPFFVRVVGGAGARMEWEMWGYLDVYEGVLVYTYSFWCVRVDFVWGGRAWLFDFLSLLLFDHT